MAKEKIKCKVNPEEIKSKVEKHWKDNNKNFQYKDFYEEFINTRSLLTIICPIHGEFKQRYFDSLKTVWGCRKCYEDSEKINKVTNPDKVLERLVSVWNEINPGFYDFSKVLESFTGMNNKIEVICPIHGSFFPQAGNFLNGHGCKLCSNIQNGINKSLGKDRFIERSIEVWGKDRWNYNKVNYVNQNIEIELYCNLHRIYYWQLPVTHLQGFCGCPKCKPTSLGENIILKYLLDNNINYIAQKTVDVIKVCSRSSVDFSININNQEYWIEFNGQQHYLYSGMFHNQSYQNFINQVNRDKAVREYALKNNIHFLEIPFLDIDRIPEILDAFLYDGLDITTKINPKILPTLWIKQN